jgi:hypothetical protein
MNKPTTQTKLPKPITEAMSDDPAFLAMLRVVRIAGKRCNEIAETTPIEYLGPLQLQHIIEAATPLINIITRAKRQLAAIDPEP